MAHCTIVTWNILALRGFAAGEDPERAPGPARPHLVAAAATALRQLDADVIAIQEAPAPSVIAELAARLDFRHCYFPARWPGNAQWPGGFPGALLTRHPLSDVRDQMAARPELDAALFLRHWGCATVHHPGDDVQVHSFHLSADWGGVDCTATRLAELAEVRTVIDRQRHPHHRVALCGDSNSAIGNAARRELDQWGGVDAMSSTGFALTAPTINPAVSIDSLWAFGPWQVEHCRVQDQPPFAVDPATGVALSDHLPVLTRLTW